MVLETKTNNKNRNRAYSRFQRIRIIIKKKKLAKMNGFTYRSDGYLAKGKIHCSCWMCSVKTKRDGFPHAQIKKLQATDADLKDFKSRLKGTEHFTVE